MPTIMAQEIAEQPKAMAATYWRRCAPCAHRSRGSWITVAGQLLAEALALALGLNPDVTRGLNKVTQTDS